MTPDLSPAALREVTAVLRTHAPGFQAWVFGSRARGTAHRYADLDLLVRGPGALPLRTWVDLREAFADAHLEFTVDVVDWHRASHRFLAAIEAELVPLSAAHDGLRSAQNARSSADARRVARCSRSLSVYCLLLLATGSCADTLTCSTQLVPQVTVVVLDAGTSARICDAVVEASHGFDATETFHLEGTGDECEYLGGMHGSGLYAVTVAKAGYATAHTSLVVPAASPPGDCFPHVSGTVVLLAQR